MTGVVDGVLRARVAAPAVDGAANDSLIRLLAAELDVTRMALRIVAGATSREKLVLARGVPADAVTSRWPGVRVSEA